MKKEYTKGNLVVIWEPERCIHSTICISNLPQVFRLGRRPWIKLDAASENEIIKTINGCPSKALSYRIEKGDRNNAETPFHAIAEIQTNGPIIMKGEVDIFFDDKPISHNSQVTAICRCGKSQKQPFCDGNHLKTT